MALIEQKLQDLERYSTIVKYFSENKDRVHKNRMQLTELMYSLKDYLEKYSLNDTNPDEKIGFNCTVKGLCSKIKNMLEESRNYSTKQEALNKDYNNWLH